MQKYNSCPSELEQLNLDCVVTGEDRQAQQEVLQASQLPHILFRDPGVLGRGSRELLGASSVQMQPPKWCCAAAPLQLAEIPGMLQFTHFRKSRRRLMTATGARAHRWATTARSASSGSPSSGRPGEAGMLIDSLSGGSGC